MAGKKVLVVDDDDEILGFVSEGLRMAGYDVYTAPDGEKGLALARSQRPDLIVLDLAMPRMHGFEVCQQIRSDGTMVGTKIIITSGKSYPVDIKTAKDAGADQYVVKPYGLQQLLESVERLLAA